MNIHDNHFALFGLAERFGLDLPALDRAYRDVQTRVHPDRFAGGGAAEQRVALQWATRANEAYRVLRDPLRRAIYLCALRGHDPADENNTHMAQEFLMQQLEWREALDDARAENDSNKVEALRAALVAKQGALRDGVEGSLDTDEDVKTAAEHVRQWMFVERFGEDVATVSDRLKAPVH
ncbi:MAG: Fe-S protein assembly co-chaperone HscB [Burkholderiaceae bacterium]